MHVFINKCYMGHLGMSKKNNHQHHKTEQRKLSVSNKNKSDQHIQLHTLAVSHTIYNPYKFHVFTLISCTHGTAGRPLLLKYLCVVHFFLFYFICVWITSLNAFLYHLNRPKAIKTTFGTYEIYWNIKLYAFLKWF